MNEISPSKPLRISEWNHVCTWRDGACRNPVGLFLESARSGWCLFHRKHPSGPMAQSICEESRIHDQESYNRAVNLETYGTGENSNVKAAKALLRPWKVDPIKFTIPGAI